MPLAKNILIEISQYVRKWILNNVWKLKKQDEADFKFWPIYSRLRTYFCLERVRKNYQKKISQNQKENILKKGKNYFLLSLTSHSIYQNELTLLVKYLSIKISKFRLSFQDQNDSHNWKFFTWKYFLWKKCIFQLSIFFVFFNW